MGWIHANDHLTFNSNAVFVEIYRDNCPFLSPSLPAFIFMSMHQSEQHFKAPYGNK